MKVCLQALRQALKTLLQGLLTICRSHTVYRFLVYLDETGKGRKKKSRLVVNNKRFSGTLLDISIGGCSIKTSIPVQAGSRMKIGIDYADNYKISTLGQVLRANRSGSLGNILHIKFLKVPRRAYNSISAIVYGYDD